jgi:hypothetical protein
MLETVSGCTLSQISGSCSLGLLLGAGVMTSSSASMSKKMERAASTSERLAAVSRLFSPGVIREMAKMGRSPKFARLARASQLINARGCAQPVSTFFEKAFEILEREGCRDEYVYKVALTRKILLGRHSLKTAAMLYEFRVGRCKADVVVLNGTSTVYEVKSERDSLARLVHQLEAYTRVFSRVCVISAEKHLPALIASAPAHVGIWQLNRRFQITQIRAATDGVDTTLPLAIFDSLRTDEARSVLLRYGIPIPPVPNTRLSAALRERFAGLTPRQAHDGMVQVLRRSRNLQPLSDLADRLPKSLQAAAFSISLCQSERARLIEAVNVRLVDALAWG